LNKFNTWNLNGGYVAAGVGMRNRGYGTINISLPSGSSIVAAYLYWDILGITADSSFARGQFNGKAISGTLIGQGPDPCWGNSSNFAYRADVTPLVTSSSTSYTLSGFRSGTTNGGDPWVSGSTAPMLEGASLVIIYQNPSAPMTQVQLYDGSFETHGVVGTLTMDGFTAPNPMVKAQTTFIGADGQTSGGDMTTFNGTQFPNIWNGADPQAGARFQYGNLWDTMTRDVTNLVTSGSTSAIASIQGTGDCLVWVAQAFSIQQSQPNPTPAPTNPPDDVTCGALSAQSVVNAPDNGPHCRPHPQSTLPPHVCAGAAREHNPQCQIQDYRNKLNTYGVSVRASEVLGLPDRLNAIRTIYNAVEAIGYKFQRELDLSSPVIAFNTVLDEQHIITVSTVSSLRCNGENSCTMGDLDTGAEMHLTTKAIEDYKEGIVIHEFGHLFTNSATTWNGELINDSQPEGWNGWSRQGINIYDFLWVFGTEADPDKNKSQAQNIAQYNFDFDLGLASYESYSGDMGNPPYYEKNAEATADAFAIWVLNSFTDNNGNPNGGTPQFDAIEAECVVKYFFKKILNVRGHQNDFLIFPASCISP
jgi:hypothetical protein